MGNVLKEYTNLFLRRHSRAKKLLSLLLCLSVFVSSGVLWQLKMIAVAADDLQLNVNYENKGTSTVVVTKNWIDGANNHTTESSFIRLYTNNSSGSPEIVATCTLSAANNWRMELNNMPTGDYWVREVVNDVELDVWTATVTAKPGASTDGYLSNVGTNIQPGNIYCLSDFGNIFLTSQLAGTKTATDYTTLNLNSNSGYFWEFTSDYKLKNLSRQDGSDYLCYRSGNGESWYWGNQETGARFVFNSNGLLCAADANLNPYSGAETNVYGAYNSGRGGAATNTNSVARAYLWTPPQPAGNTYSLTIEGAPKKPVATGNGGFYSASDFEIIQNKTIDSLIDENPDTKVMGDDFYRLYLDVLTKTSANPNPVDLMLVVDQSWSMGNSNDNYLVNFNGVKVKRDEALTNILLGYDGNKGLIESFLALNSNNKISIVGFDGTRFIGGGKYDSSALSGTATPVPVPGTNGDVNKTPFEIYDPLKITYKKSDNVSYEMFPYGSAVKGSIEKVVGSSYLHEPIWPYSYKLDSRIISGWTTYIDTSNIDVKAAYSSGTNYEAGLMQAADMWIADKDSTNTKVMIFISDGVPTCFIYNEEEAGLGRYTDHEQKFSFAIEPGDRGGTTMNDMVENINYCKEPSKYAFHDFLNKMKANNINLTVHTVGISGEVGTEVDAEVLKYYADYGGGQMFLSGNNADDLLKQLKSLMLSDAPNNLVITDTLSSYVEYYSYRPDVKITMTAPNNSETVIYDGATNYKDSNIVESVTYDSTSRTVTAKFKPEYSVQLGYKYTLSYNVMVNEEAYKDYIIDGNYPTKGATGSDYAGNDTSSNQDGFYSNKEAQVTCKFAGATIGEKYDHPVVQIDTADAKTAGSITVYKTWQDAYGQPIAAPTAGVVTLQLHQVGIFEDNVTDFVPLYYDKEYGDPKQINLTANETEVTFTDLPRYEFDENGLRFRCTYYVVETDNRGYQHICYLADVNNQINESSQLVNEKQGVTPEENTKLVLINKERLIVPPTTPVPTGGVDINKSIDDLSDGVDNKDTNLQGTDNYRIYLDVDSDVVVEEGFNKEPIDLILVVDKSWSMHDNNIYFGNSQIARYEALQNVLMGTDNNVGFIDSFLEANPKNNVAIIGFDGIRFTSRDVVSESNVNTEYYIADKNGYCEDLGAINPNYNYKFDSEVIQGWTSAGDWKSSGNKASVKDSLAPTLYAATNYMAGLDATLEMLKSSESDNKKVVVFLSDGVPTCYIYQEGDRFHRGGTTNDDNSTNVALCSEMSAIAYKDFIDSVLLDLEITNFTFNSIGIADNLDSNSLLAGFTYGGGMFVQANSDVSNLYAALMAMTVNNQAVKPDNIVISDTLSAYVKLADTPDILITKTSADGTVTKLYEGNKITKDGYGVIQSVEVTDVNVGEVGSSYKTQKITAKFVSNYALEPGAKYELSYNVSVTQTAYEEFETNGYTYPNEGANTSDYGGNSTSAGKEGFNSNHEAEVSYDDGDSSTTNTPEEFPHPVIQLDYGQITVVKEWKDSVTGTPIDGKDAPFDSVKVQLHRVETPMYPPTPGHWELVTGDLVSGEKYLIVAKNNYNVPNSDNQILHKIVFVNGDNRYPRAVIFNDGEKIFNSSSTSYDEYKNYVFLYENGQLIWDPDGNHEYMQIAAYTQNNNRLGYFEISSSSNSNSATTYITNNNGLRTIRQTAWRNNGSDYFWLRVFDDYNNGLQIGTLVESEAATFQFYKFVSGGTDYTEGTKTDSFYGEAVKLEKSNGWTYTFNALLKHYEADDGTIYYYSYYLEELEGPYTSEVVATTGANGTYVKDGKMYDTMVKGTYMVTNSIERNFTLPSAGGGGIHKNIISGLVIISGGLIYGIRLRRKWKRERRQSSA